MYLCILQVVTNSGRASTLAATDAATPTLRRIERAAIAAATPITYHSRYFVLAFCWGCVKNNFSFLYIYIFLVNRFFVLFLFYIQYSEQKYVWCTLFCSKNCLENK